MTLTNQSDGVSPPTSVRLVSSDLQFTESGPPTSRFELTFCGVLVLLIFAIIGILLAVAFKAMSGP
jgi:hypothetical protein